jgi:hypothetical protein
MQNAFCYTVTKPKPEPEYRHTIHHGAALGVSFFRGPVWHVCLFVCLFVCFALCWVLGCVFALLSFVCWFWFVGCCPFRMKENSKQRFFGVDHAKSNMPNFLGGVLRSRASVCLLDFELARSYRPV